MTRFGPSQSPYANATFNPKSSCPLLPPLSARLLGCLQPITSLGPDLPYMILVAECRSQLSGSSPECHGPDLYLPHFSPCLPWNRFFAPRKTPKYVFTCMSLSASR